ncbi:glycosyl transferase family protein [Calothrix sp. NIES-2100]|uniref:hormogonium polysaccharide biosynthesis glycosyltransferase HpsE n=1 Tax=Calothrix sp. NIES-2100 TaxID=1954172 RepID=UPI000B5EC0B4|nr:glycosyl transferase family protein [Calothrix sp. NIES-2100]
MNNKTLDEQLDISVAIPTYNGAERLPKILARLLAQTGIEKLTWEIIIIDNNSSDNTPEIIHNYQNNWNHKSVLRYFREPKQGIAFARQRAVSEARGELIAFLDDDNLPDPNWVFQADDFAKNYPKAGAWSGQIHGDFEVNPPENFDRIQSFLAIRENGTQPYIFDAKNLRLPPGAALVVRKQAWCESVPENLVFKGRLNKLMVGGDDAEALLYLNKAGWEIWYNPTMHTYHQIPHWRLEREYLLALARGSGLCICQLRFINASNWQKFIVFFKILFSNMLRFLKHVFKYKLQDHHDLITLVEIHFYLGSMISPFYLLKCYLGKC